MRHNAGVRSHKEHRHPLILYGPRGPAVKGCRAQSGGQFHRILWRPRVRIFHGARRAALRSPCQSCAPLVNMADWRPQVPHAQPPGLDDLRSVAEGAATPPTRCPSAAAPRDVSGGHRRHRQRERAAGCDGSDPGHLPAGPGVAGVRRAAPRARDWAAARLAPARACQRPCRPACHLPRSRCPSLSRVAATT